VINGTARCGLKISHEDKDLALIGSASQHTPKKLYILSNNRESTEPSSNIQEISPSLKL